MIKPIPDTLPIQTGEWNGTTFDIIPRDTFALVVRKINEIIDVMNKPSTTDPVAGAPLGKLPPAPTSDNSEKPNDPFAEKRKWIGCLVEFNHQNKSGVGYGILTAIHPKRSFPYEINDGEWHAFDVRAPSPDVFLNQTFPDLTEQYLRKKMQDPKYWRDRDPKIVRMVENGFKKLYGDNE